MKRKTALFYLLFASFLFAQSESKEHLSVLSFSGLEIQSLDKYLDGSALIDDKVNKKEFLLQMEKYDLIHLATHTIIDKSNSMRSRFYISNNPEINSEDAAVFVSDIFPLNLKAKLAVLSSCNTGVGEVVAGEGIMSLARAFVFAGCPSVIMSLWEIDDISTPKIMSSFYSGLRNGARKDEALRNAKLKYLESANSKNAAPVFWAASVAIGQMNNLRFHKKSWSQYIILIFLLPLFAAASFLIIKRKFNRG